MVQRSAPVSSTKYSFFVRLTIIEGDCLQTPRVRSLLKVEVLKDMIGL